MSADTDEITRREAEIQSYFQCSELREPVCQNSLRGISDGPFWYDGLLTHLPGAVPQTQDLPRVVVSQLRRQRVLRQVLIADGPRKTIDGMASD